MIVHSGRGIHLYYVYEHSIPAKTKDGIINTRLLRLHKNFVDGINQLVKDVVASTQLSVDDASTDTSRYARVPGTLNPNTNTMCYLVHANGPHYTFAELSEVIS